MAISGINNYGSQPIKQKNTPKQTSKKESGYTPGESYEKSSDKGFIGKVVDGITNFVKNYIITPGSDFGEQLKTDFKTQAITTGTIVGGVAGAIIGHQAGEIEQSLAQSQHLHWQEPDMYKKYTGNVPQSHYQHAWGFSWSVNNNRYDIDGAGNLTGASHGIKANYERAPVLDNGVPRMHPVEETVNSQRFGPKSGAVGGFMLGSIGGALGGLAVSMVHKLLRDKNGS